jgi:hypothetical protein
MYRRKGEGYGCRFKREEGNMGAVLGHAERGITVSKAITILSVHAQNAIGMATIGNDRAYEEYLALEMGIQALQKQLVDRVPCERCDSAPPLSRHCPNCGAKMDLNRAEAEGELQKEAQHE